MPTLYIPIGILSLLLLIIAIYAYLIRKNLEGRNIELSRKSSQNELLEQNIQKLENTLEGLQEKYEKRIEIHQTALQEIARLENALQETRQRLQKEEENETIRRKETSQEFARLAEKIINEKSQQVTLTQSEQLQTILAPLKEKIEDFKKKVEDTHLSDTRERSGLREMIKQLSEQQHSLSREANALSEALRGQSKVQGDWGEMILGRLLEESGLTEGREYELQPFLTEENGTKVRHDETNKKLRPDAIIHFPQERDVIVDSKVSLTAFVEYHEAQNEEERSQALDRHIASVRKHIDELSHKDYCGHLRSSADFVLMFVPNEGAFTLAVQAHQGLWNEAYRKKVLLMGPSNLYGMLKIISDLWSKERQIKNIEAIIEAATKMYDKFAGFSDNFERIGLQIDALRGVFDKAKTQLSSGRGNIIKQLSDLQKMGISPRKNIAPGLKAIPEGDEQED